MEAQKRRKFGSVLLGFGRLIRLRRKIICHRGTEALKVHLLGCVCLFWVMIDFALCKKLSDRLYKLTLMFYGCAFLFLSTGICRANKKDMFLCFSASVATYLQANKIAFPVAVPLRQFSFPAGK